MKTEDKELLLRDLSGRLLYGVKCKVSYNSGVINDADATLYGMDKDGFLMFDEIGGDHREFLCKPYLFPLSSMSREQLNDFYATIRPVIEESLEEYDNDKTDYEGERPITMKTIKCDIVAVNWMLKNHFDINGLLPMDLAIDATGLNIYKEG